MLSTYYIIYELNFICVVNRSTDNKADECLRLKTYMLTNYYLSA